MNWSCWKKPKAKSFNYVFSYQQQRDRVVWSTRWAHNPEIGGSNPLPAILFAEVLFLRWGETPTLPLLFIVFCLVVVLFVVM